MNENNKNGFLPRKAFYWTIGIVIMVFMSVMGYTIGKVDDNTENFNHNFTTVTNEISSIKTDISWIKDKLKDF